MQSQKPHDFMLSLVASLDLLELFPGLPLLKCGAYKFDVSMMAFSEAVQTDLAITQDEQGFVCRFTDFSSDEQREHTVRCIAGESAKDFADKIHAELCAMHTRLHDGVKQ